MHKQAFTLIELLVVIAIIALLASVVVANFDTIRTSSKVVLAKAQMTEIVNFIEMARVTQGKTLYEITQNGYSMASCVASGSTLKSLSDSHGCIVVMTAAFQKIANAIGDQTVMGYFRDPWGSPYLWDENEGQQVENPCVEEQVISVGGDAIYGTSDDFFIAIPFFTTECRTL